MLVVAVCAYCTLLQSRRHTISRRCLISELAVVMSRRCSPAVTTVNVAVAVAGARTAVGKAGANSMVAGVVGVGSVEGAVPPAIQISD